MVEYIFVYFSDFRGEIVEDWNFIFINFLFLPVAHFNNESFDNITSEMFSSGESVCSILKSTEEGLYDVLNEDDDNFFSLI